MATESVVLVGLLCAVVGIVLVLRAVVTGQGVYAARGVLLLVIGGATMFVSKSALDLGRLWCGSDRLSQVICPGPGSKRALSAPESSATSTSCSCRRISRRHFWSSAAPSTALPTIFIRPMSSERQFIRGHREFKGLLRVRWAGYSQFGPYQTRADRRQKCAPLAAASTRFTVPLERCRLAPHHRRIRACQHPHPRAQIHSCPGCAPCALRTCHVQRQKYTCGVNSRPLLKPSLVTVHGPFS